MYTVKKLGKNGMWNAVSLIDDNGSFRGEARFETKQEAERYMAVYIKRLRNPASAMIDGKPALKVFKDEPKTGAATDSRKP
ncbi:MAG: hypothetical protein ABI361_01830 [Nitrososphaera sp.]